MRFNLARFNPTDVASCISALTVGIVVGSYSLNVPATIAPMVLVLVAYNYGPRVVQRMRPQNNNTYVSGYRLSGDGPAPKKPSGLPPSRRFVLRGGISAEEALDKLKQLSVSPRRS